MNIFASPGDKVRYSDYTSGRDGDIIRAIMVLERGVVYTIKRVVVDRYRTTVWLKEIKEDDQKVGFNSTLFEDVKIRPVPAAARSSYYYEKSKYIPFDTDKVDIQKTIHYVREFVSFVLNISPELFSKRTPDYKDEYDIGIMLFSTTIVGADIKKAIGFTGLPEGDVVVWWQCADELGILDYYNRQWWQENTAVFTDDVGAILNREQY